MASYISKAILLILILTSIAIAETEKKYYTLEDIASDNATISDNGSINGIITDKNGVPITGIILLDDDGRKAEADFLDGLMIAARRYNDKGLLIQKVTIDGDGEAYIYREDKSIQFIAVYQKGEASEAYCIQGDKRTKIELNAPMPDCNWPPVTLESGHYVAGEDFPAGKYDIVALRGNGSVTSSNIENGIMAMIGVGDKYFQPRFNNATLPEGATLSINGVTIELQPK
jgi:hypothetical protein